MKKLMTFISLAFALVSCQSQAQQNSTIIYPGSSVELLSDGFSFTEGPSADNHGNVYFTDQPNDRIHIWTVDGELLTFLDNTGRANGTYFDHDGNLLSCSDMDNELWSINADSSLSNRTLFAEMGSDGMTIDEKGNIYLTGRGALYSTPPANRSNTFRSMPDGPPTYVLEAEIWICCSSQLLNTFMF